MAVFQIGEKNSFLYTLSILSKKVLKFHPYINFNMGLYYNVYFRPFDLSLRTDFNVS